MRTIRRGFLLLTLVTLTSNLLAQQSSTTVPNLIRYGGVLKDAKGSALASRTVGITFLIYGQQDGGAPVWLETQNVAIDAVGQYNVLLGSTAATGLPSDLFAQQEQRWLAVKAEGQAEQPRVLMVSVPYAMKAAVADTLAGHSASEFVTTDNLQSAVQQLQGQATTVAPGTAAGTNSKSTAAVNTPVPTNTATNFVDTTTNQVVLVQQNGTGVGLWGSSPSVGVLGTVNSGPKAGISAGVEGTSSINNGFGMFGYSTATSLGVGVQGRSDSPNGTGVRGWTTGTNAIAVNATSNATSGSPVGLYASVSAPNGTGALITNIAGGTITGPLINAVTNNVTQFAVGATGNVSATGWLSGKQLISTVATGTAPLQVASTTQVPNLNASLLGGKAASAFALASGSPNYIQNGTAVQPSANFNISGTGTATSFNSVTSYQIGGSSVLSIGAFADFNVFLGAAAGADDIAGQGIQNTFVGHQSGQANTTGNSNTFVGDAAGQNNTTGVGNTFNGYAAGANNITGGGNTFSGYAAGSGNNASGNSFFGSGAGWQNTTGDSNAFIGEGAGLNNKTGWKNTFTGSEAGYSNTGGALNTFVGHWAGYGNTTGGFNTFLGEEAGWTNTTGDSNTFVGFEAGWASTGQGNIFAGLAAGVENTTGSSNIYIGNRGCTYPCTESSTIRIGGDTGYSSPQTAAYIAGIYGTNIGSGTSVFINSNGQLGTLTSSRRFKEQIRDMGDSTNGLMSLRPVTFLYKPQYDKGPRTLQYGLIAEEVAEVYPDLVAYESDGKPYTVKYQYLTTMLLNEMQKQYHRAQAEAVVITQQEDKIDAQQRQIAEMQRRLERLESLIDTPVKIAQSR